MKARQGVITADPRVQAIKATRFWEQKRAVHLLTGLVRCGSCGGTLGSVGKDYMACTAARKLKTCGQRQSVRRKELEALVLELLRTRLMQPDAVAGFMKEYTSALNVQRGDESATRRQQEGERTEIKRKLTGLYDAIADGLRTAGLKERLEDLEAKLALIDAALAAPAPQEVRLHPNLSELYRRKVGDLSIALGDTQTRPQALEAIRGLISGVVVRIDTAGVHVTLEGAITALLDMAKLGVGRAVSGRSVEVVAGVGFEPTTFRL